MPRSSVPWAEVQARYVTGDDTVTHRTLASEFGVRRETVQRRAGRDGWADERVQHRRTIVVCTEQKTREAVSDEFAKINSEVAREAARGALQAVRLFNALAEDREGFSRQQFVGMLGVKGAATLRALATAAGIMIDKFRLAGGMTTSKIEQARDVAFEDMTPEQQAEYVRSAELLMERKRCGAGGDA